MYYIKGDNSTLLFYNGKTEVGRITYTDLIPCGLFDSLATDEEEAVVESLECVQTNLHLGHLLINEEFRGRGYMEDMVKMYHNYAKYKGYSKSHLVCEPYLTHIYERCGYAKIYHLESIGMDIMLANI